MSSNEVRIEGANYDLVIATRYNGNVEIAVMESGKDMDSLDTPENYWVGDPADVPAELTYMVNSWESYERASA